MNCEGYFAAIPKDIVGIISKFANRKSFPADRFPSVTTIPVGEGATVSCSPNGCFYSILDRGLARTYSISDSSNAIDYVHPVVGTIVCHTADNNGRLFLGVDNGASFSMQASRQWYCGNGNIERAIMEVDSDGNVVLLFMRRNESYYHFCVFDQHDGRDNYIRLDSVMFTSFTHRFTVDGEQRACLMTTAFSRFDILYSHEITTEMRYDSWPWYTLDDCDNNTIHLNYPDFIYHQECGVSMYQRATVNYGSIVYCAITSHGHIVIFVK